MDEIAYRYIADANPDAATIPGVPLRDLTQADVVMLTLHQLAGVKACRFYTAEAAATPDAVVATAEATATPDAVVAARRRAPVPSESKNATEG